MNSMGQIGRHQIPAFGSFRLSNLGLDFGIGSDRMLVKNSALLLQALEDEPEKTGLVCRGNSR